MRKERERAVVAKTPTRERDAPDTHVNDEGSAKVEVDVRQEAVAAIEEELARTLAGKGRGALIVVEVDPAGDGVVLARSATLERANKLTGQVTDIVRACDKAGLRPKLIVAGAGISGAKPLEERPDLVAVIDALDGEGCTWVAVWDAHRIARSVSVHMQFVEELDARSASLYVGDPVRLLADGSVERHGALMLVASAQEERERLVERPRLGRDRKRATINRGARSRAECWPRGPCRHHRLMR